MSKISELGPIKGANTRSEDLFVIVNLIQGDDGTKNITRKELVQAIQYEIFDRITITGGKISGVRIFNSTLDNNVMEENQFNNGDIETTDITRSTFVDGSIADSTADQVAITNSDFTDGTGNNNVFANTIVDFGQLNNSTGNNDIFTNSQIDDSLFNRVQIEGGTANNLVMTNIEIDELVLEDATISNSQIITTDFSNGTISDSTAANVAISESSFANGDIRDTNLDNVIITNSLFANGNIGNTAMYDSTIANTIISESSFANGSIADSSANNMAITNSDFSDGTGNNNVFTNPELVDATLTGSMDSVVATNIQISSSTSDGLDQQRSTITNSDIKDSNISNTVIDDSQLADFDMNLTKVFEPKLDEDSYFALKNVQTGDTEKMTYRQLYEEFSKTTEKALKVHVASDGDDKNPGTILKPVRTLKRAEELALEKAGGSYDRNDINNAVHISVGPGTYYVDEPIKLPDDCVLTSTAGQYATVIQKKPGWERTNGILVGSGCYVQGFAYMNFEVDNFDNPEGGFAIAYRPGALLRRSPYLRDSSQLSNFNRLDVEPPLNPFNSKGTVYDLGQEFYMEVGHSAQSLFEKDDEVTFSSGARGYISYIDDIDSNHQIYVRNLKGNVEVGDMLYAQRGGTGTVSAIGIDDFPNREVGRGGGCLLADRAVLDTDSLYTYVLCFGFTPRTQNGTGYVAKNGAGVNGIGSLSIFTRQAFFALDGGQMTLNNSGSQFGDISMRAKGNTVIIKPAEADQDNLLYSEDFADAIVDNKAAVLDDMVAHLTANTSSGGLGYQGYNADKCFRDTGIIVDNTGYDIATNSNYWGRLNGITYRSPISYVVVNEQLTETVGSIEHLKDYVNFIFENTDQEVRDRVNTSLNETLNVLQNGEEFASPIIFADTGDGPAVAAREVVQDNRDFIIEEFVSWLDNNEDFYAYDSAKCQRDVKEYILPAVKYDTMLGTNYNSVTAGNAYFFNATKNVIGAQREETVGAYERLRLTTDKLVEGTSSSFAVKAYEKFNEIIDILKMEGDKYTPTNATYNPTSGEFVITLGTHNIEVGRYILLSPEAFTFSCNTDGNVLQYSHPRKTDPAFKAAMPVIAADATTITLNVGSTGYAGVHTLVDIATNAVTVLGSAIEFSDDTNIPADKRNARKQLQANREFIQDYMMNWADNEWFFYDSKKCSRDMKEYIVPAVLRDMQTGTNFNSIQSGIAYRQGIAKVAVTDQLTETVGAVEHLKSETVDTLDNAIAKDRVAKAYDEIIGLMQTGARQYTPSNATYDPATGISVITIENHGLQVGDQILLDEAALTFSCANTSTGLITEISHPRTTDPAYELPLTIYEATADTVTIYVGDAGGYTGAHTFARAKLNGVKQYAVVNAEFTPTTGTYDPVTGLSELTIGAHNVKVGDHVVLQKEGITFECDSPAVQISHPRLTDPAFNGLVPVTAVTDNTITVDVGDAGGYTGVHTFVSAVDGFVKTVRLAGGKFTPTDATYDPVTGVSVITIGAHDLRAGDTIKIAQESLTFECGSPAEQISHPRATDPGFDVDLPVVEVTDNTITVNVGTANGYTGAHTFVSAKSEAIHLTSPYNGKFTPQTASYDPVTGDMTVVIGQHNLSVGKWISIADESITFECGSPAVQISHPRPTDPAHKAPIRITGVTPTTITFNVGNAGGYTGAHTFVNAENDCIDTNAIYWTDAAKIASFHTPTTASYDPATGEMVIDFGAAHSLTTDDHIEFKPQSMVFSCVNTATSDTVEISHPRIGEPNYEMPLEITAVAANTITVNVGTANGYTGTHTFVSAEEGAIVKLPENVTRQGALASKLLQANRKFLQDDVDTWIRDNYFVYNDALCQRDTGLILDAVRRDMATNSNVNSVFAGLAYRSGNASTDSVIANELTETVGAINWLKDEIATNIVNGEAQLRANTAFEEIIDIMENGTANADIRTTGVGYVNDEAYEAQAALQANKQFIIDETTAWIANTYPTLSYDSAKCERDVGYFIDAVSWDIQHGSNASTVNNSRLYFDKAASVLPEEERPATAEAFRHAASLAGQVVRNELVVNSQQSATTQVLADNTTYTPTTATYDPVTGISEITIGAHSYKVGDRISLEEGGITFECGSPAVQISHPRATDPFFNKPITIEAVTSTSITVNVGTANGYTGAHTFVSASANAVKSAIMQPTYTPTDATYDPQTGISTITIGTHRLEAGDWIIMDEEGLTFSCANTSTGVVTNISHPRATDPYFNRPVKVLEATDTSITINCGAVPNGYAGVHTFVSADANMIRKASKPEVASEVIDLFSIVANMVEGNDFAELPAIKEPTLSGTDYDANITTMYEEIAGATPKYQREIIDFIREKYNGLAYNTDLCYRDVGYIVDAVAEDIEYGGDAATSNAAQYYFENAVNILPYEQREPTRLAFEHLADVVEDVITETTVTPVFGANFTPTTATYDPETGVFVATIGTHTLKAGDYIWMEEESITFECDSPAVQISHPRSTDPYFEKPVKILAADATTITMQVGDAGGYTGTHTFISADANAIKEVKHGSAQVKNGMPGDATVAARAKTLTNVVSDVVDNRLVIPGLAGSLDISQQTPEALPTSNTSIEPAIEPSRTFARKALQMNKEFIQDEVVAYIDDEYFIYNEDKCSRDVGYIIDAVTRDVRTGSDYASKYAGRAYRAGNASTDVVINDQLAETVEAIKYVKTGVLATLSGTAKTAATTAFNNVIDIMQNGADNITYNFGTSGVRLSERVATDGLQANIAFLKAEVIAWINKQITDGTAGFVGLSYDSVKCARDVGYMIDAVSFDIRHGSNVAIRDVANFYFENGNSILPADQRQATNLAFRHLADTAYKVLLKQTVTPTAGNTETQSVNFGNVVGATAQEASDLFNIVSSVIEGGSLIVMPAAQEVNPEAYGSPFGYDNEDSVALIEAVKPTLQSGVNTYLQETFNYLEYNSVKCRRDVGYMVDAISHDIQYGGNSAMWNAAQIYFVNTTNLLPLEQREPTKKAFTHMGKVIEHVIRHEEVERKLGRSFNVTDATYAPGSGLFTVTLENNTLKAGDYFMMAEESITFECNGIQISHPRASDPFFNRPVEVISVAGNVVTANVGRAGTYTGAHTFVSATKGAVQKVVGNTQVQYMEGLVARRDIAKEAKDLALMVANIAYDNNPTNLPARVEPYTNWMDGMFRTEKDKVDNALESLVESMINFISTEYNGISYPKAKCRRDIGIIIDALSHDVQYETNYATRLAANMYFDNAVSVLPFDQRTQTADFYEEMAELVSNIVVEQVAGQDTSNDAASGTEMDEVMELVRIIEEAIRRDSLDALPELIEPNTSWVDADEVQAANIIDENLDDLADDVTKFIADNYTIIDYSKAKCRRDAGYIIDAMSWDLNYGGNIASRWNADFYFWNNELRIPENTREATAQSYRELGRIVSKVAVGQYPGQTVRPEMGSEVQEEQAYELGLIFYNALYYNTPRALGPTIQPDFAWEEDKTFNFAKMILSDNRTKLQREVQRFITSEYKFIDLPKTYRDGENLLKLISNDVRYYNPAFQRSGGDTATRSAVGALFNIDAQHVFPVFNPPTSFADWRKLRFKGTTESLVSLNNIVAPKRWDAYIIPTDNNGSRYVGEIYQFNGNSWVLVGNNNTDLLDAFVGAWLQMKTYINNNIATNADQRTMITELMDNVLIDSVIRPNFLVFGSLVESIAHQFNGASAGVNRNALPLNFRNVGAAIGANASVLSEDGGRIRWSGSDELNNQYFARGLRINGRTGRIEGRPFTSSVRKLARRASNSRASL